MQEPGFAFYAAPFRSVIEACSDETALRALREGATTPHCAHFAPVVGPADVLLLSNAFAAALGRDLEFEIERVETEIGLFVDRVFIPWVQAVAALPDSEVRSVCADWCKRYALQEEREPDWTNLDQVPAVTALVHVCRAAQDGLHDVVMVWAL